MELNKGIELYIVRSVVLVVHHFSSNVLQVLNSVVVRIQLVLEYLVFL